MKSENKIDQNTTLEKVLECKGSKEILEKYNDPCLTCPFAAMEMGELKIGDICKNYGISMEELIDDLNKLLK